MAKSGRWQTRRRVIFQSLGSSMWDAWEENYFRAWDLKHKICTISSVHWMCGQMYCSRGWDPKYTNTVKNSSTWWGVKIFHSMRWQRWGGLLWEQTSIKANHTAVSGFNLIPARVTWFEKKSQHPVMQHKQHKNHGWITVNKLCMIFKTLIAKIMKSSIFLRFTESPDTG